MNHILRYISFVLSLLIAAVVSQPSVSAQTGNAGDAKKEYRSSFFKFGVKGGIDFISLDRFKAGEVSDAVRSYTGFSAGAVFSFDLPVQGMTLQPELNYISKGAKIMKEGEHLTNIRVDYIELPVNWQVGLDLILMRPFVAITPYIGYALYHTPADMGWDHFSRFEYGIGVGGGIDVWRFQLQFTYKWNLSSIMQPLEVASGDVVLDPSQELVQAVKDCSFRGFEINLAFFF